MLARGIGVNNSNDNIGDGTLVTVNGLGNTSSAIGLIWGESLNANNKKLNVTTKTAKAIGLNSNQDYNRKDIGIAKAFLS